MTQLAQSAALAAPSLPVLLCTYATRVCRCVSVLVAQLAKSLMSSVIIFVIILIGYEIMVFPLVGACMPLRLKSA